VDYDDDDMLDLKNYRWESKVGGLGDRIPQWDAGAEPQ